MDFKVYATSLIFSLFGINAFCWKNESNGQTEKGVTERIMHSVIKGVLKPEHQKNTCEDIRNKTSDNITNSRATESAKMEMGKQNDQMYIRCIEDRVSQDLEKIKQHKEK